MVDRMSLPVIDRALTAYIKGELSLEVHIRIEQVLDHDPEAAARVAMLRGLIAHFESSVSLGTCSQTGCTGLC
ncbi:hypothetical protein SAE02_73420 [Skermanella aerolata]|uniref:Uncharacterized protein n=1 Tax=Skermanella aerolata TaxID=393310 RepID=A0A512E393_9PROT|nr:hypothetical protein SAE02_73420 [Skermanella aerolata]